MTNPIWVVKTRLQLAQDHAGAATASSSSSASSAKRVADGSLSTIRDIFRQEGVRGFYKGLSASYLGVTEGTIQWVLYERLKSLSQSVDGQGGAGEWLGMLASAGTAKCVASLITYPHEVVRTRLRQPVPDNGIPKYTGLLQTFKLVVKEEGVRRCVSLISYPPVLCS